MSGRKWYQVNIYPLTKRGEFTLAVFENEGYSWRCEAHSRPRCRGCADFLRRRMVTSYRVTSPETADLTEVVETALSLVREDLGQHGTPPRSFLRPWSITPQA